MPPEGLPGSNESQPRAYGLPADLRAVPHHGKLDRREVRPLQRGFPAHRARTPSRRAPAPTATSTTTTTSRLRPASSCHQNDFNNATIAGPPHRLPDDLRAVPRHRAVDRRQVRSLDHRLPLTGAHTVPPRACTDCHVNNNYNLTTNTCVSCHLKDFQGATNPNHVAGGFAQTCDMCHNTAAWQPATFDHSKSGFPLTGSHMVPPRAVRRLPRQQQLQHHGHNVRQSATRPTSTTPRRRCRIRASRRLASSATTPCSGPTQSLITPPPASR